MKIKVYGASDDLIEIEGDIREEFPAKQGSGNVVLFSDGTALSIVYGEFGIWRIAHIVQGASEVIIDTSPPGDDERYSDIAIVNSLGDIKWVAHTDQWGFLGIGP